MKLAAPEHEASYQEMCDLLKRHADKVSAVDLLAIASNMIGKLIALQDQRTMTREKAMKIVVANIEEGNRQVFSELEKTVGSS